MNAITIIPFPNLSTEHFILRKLAMKDENEIFALRSDENVNQFLDRPKASSIDDARQFINKIHDGIANSECILWVITLKNNNKLMGTICLWKISKEDSKAEIGYELLPQHQGRGIMQEVIPVIIKYGFENMQLRSIKAELSPNNLKSIKLLERNNFVRISVDESADTVVYALANNIDVK